MKTQKSGSTSSLTKNNFEQNLNGKNEIFTNRENFAVQDFENDLSNSKISKCNGRNFEINEQSKSDSNERDHSDKTSITNDLSYSDDNIFVSAQETPNLSPTINPGQQKTEESLIFNINQKVRKVSSVGSSLLRNSAVIRRASLSVQEANNNSKEKIKRLENFSQKNTATVKSYRYAIFNFSEEILKSLMTHNIQDGAKSDIEQFIFGLKNFDDFRNDESWIQEVVSSGVSVDYALPVPVSQKSFDLVMEIIKENNWEDKLWSSNHAISHLLRRHSSKNSDSEINRFSGFSYISVLGRNLLFLMIFFVKIKS